MQEIEIIAEIGSTWRIDDLEASRALLLKGINQAALAGATGVKLQVFRADTLYARDRAPRHHEALRRYELPLAWLPQIRQECRDNLIGLWASVFDVSLVDEIAPYLDGFKIASGDLTYDALVSKVAKTAQDLNLPIALSTGAATYLEVYRALELACCFAPSEIILMQCVSNYPASARDYDLAAGLVFEDWVDRVGLSDHCLEPLPAQLAAAMGYTYFEKHFKPARELGQEDSAGNPDAPTSLCPCDFSRYVNAIQLARAIKGTGKKQPCPAELDERVWARRGKDGLRPTEEGHE